jgi:1A family penicillin-binding protein
MKKTLLKFFLATATAVFLIFTFLIFLWGYELYGKTPDVKNLKNFQMKQTSYLYDQTGQTVLYEIHGTEDRKIILEDKIPTYLKIATIAAEDKNFFQHKGFDISAILRAAKVNIESQKPLQGASTITQQLARDIYLNRDKNYKRKIKELFLAIKIEKKLTKNEILNMYLNKITYGSNIYGVQRASEEFFGKDAENLTLDEAALLAALPKAPSRLSPYGENTQELIKRQKNILFEIKKNNPQSKSIVNKALKEDTLKKIQPRSSKITAPHFVFHVLKELENKYSKIITTLNLSMQEKAQEIIEKTALKNKQEHDAENASLVAINPKNGEILAMVGSKDYFDQEIDGKFNAATSLRQPGSAFKPIVYATAFEKGFQPETLLYDVKTNFGSNGSNKEYIPENYTKQFRGLISMRKALAGSINIPAVKTLYLAGIKNVVNLGQEMNIMTLKQKNYKDYGLSLALGSQELSLLELTSAYSVFANDGKNNPPSSIKKITNSQNKVVFSNSPINKQVISSPTARKINSILADSSARQTTFGRSSALDIPGKQVAAKTGTTQDYRDGWTVGYTPSLSAGIWVGNNDNTPMKTGSAGIYVAAPAWKKFMTEFLTGSSNSQENFGDYEKIKSDKFMLTGKIEKEIVFYNNKSGEKIESEKKLRKTDPEKIRIKNAAEPHSILYYINKEDPLNLESDQQDPMLKKWEQAIKTKPDPEK